MVIKPKQSGSASTTQNYAGTITSTGLPNLRLELQPVSKDWLRLPIAILERFRRRVRWRLVCMALMHPDPKRTQVLLKRLGSLPPDLHPLPLQDQ